MQGSLALFILGFLSSTHSMHPSRVQERVNGGRKVSRIANNLDPQQSHGELGILSETEINNLSDEEFADFLGDLAETNEHGAQIVGGSPNFEIMQGTQGNDVDPTNEWQELTSGQKLSLRTKLSFEIEPSWKIKPEIGHRKMDEELQNLRNFAESAGNTGGIERNSLGVLENGLGVLKNSADIDKIEEELSEIKESLANQEMFQHMMEMKEKTKKSSIVMYEKAVVGSDRGLSNLMSDVRELCDQCQIDHLESIGAFVLQYTSSNHMPASAFMSFTGVSYATEDDIIMPPDDTMSSVAHQDVFRFKRQNGGVVPNDPQYDMQWALGDSVNNADINWLESRAKFVSETALGDEIVVAVIDTGVDYNHPDLTGAMWVNPREIPDNGVDDDNNGVVDDIFGADFVNGPNGDPMDDNGHGTHCAGIVGATTDNGIGIAGVAGFAEGRIKLMAVKVMGAMGFGTQTTIFRGIDYAIRNGARVSSNSYGGISFSASRALEVALNQNPGHLYVAASGNNLQRIQDNYFPCGALVPNLICVGSTTRDNTLSSFSNFGIPYVHVLAPGTDILSTAPNGGYVSGSGTSFACPHISGLAGVVMSLIDDADTSDTSEEIISIQAVATVRQLILENVAQQSQYATLVTSGGLPDCNKTVDAALAIQPIPRPTTTSTPSTTSITTTTSTTITTTTSTTSTTTTATTSTTSPTIMTTTSPTTTTTMTTTTSTSTTSTTTTTPTRMTSSTTTTSTTEMAENLLPITPDPTQPPSPCKDKDEKFCQNHKEACETHDKLRTVYCPKTCGVCMGEEVEECEDHHPTGECQKLAGLACQFKRFGELCRRSCGLCPTTVVTPPPPTIPTSTCVDHHPTSECQKLASQACHFRRFGELCRRTCGLC